MLILQLLASYLTLGVDPPDDPDAAGGGGADPPDNPDDAGLPDLEHDDPDPDPDLSADDPAALRAQLQAEKTARETAERNHRDATERLAAAQRVQAQPPAPTQDQQIFEQEEARLRAADITAQERWQIESNRVLRANSRMAAQSLMEAREMADRTEFERIAASKPGIAKKYAARVEAKLAEIRKGGQNIPRKVVLQLLIGEDIVNGTVKTTKKAAPDATSTTTVPRGKPAAGRSDVRARGASTEHDKRKARLENQII